MKKNIMFFYKESHGELHVGLPLILELKAADKKLKTFFICHEAATYNNLPSFYKKIIEENFELLILTKKNILRLYLRYFLNKNILLTCNSGHNFYTKALSCLWLTSRVAFFPHAYSIEGKKVDMAPLVNIKTNPLRYSGFHHDPVFIANSDQDVEHLMRIGFKFNNIVVAGFLGYSKKWINYLIDNTNTLNQLVEEKQGFEQVVFIPMRNHHAQYLTQENFNYLCQSVSEFVEKFPEYFFIIKPHPRQDDMHGLDQLSNNVNNLMITDVSTLSVSSISDIVISFWSSAIVDAISVKVPVIEFHKHDFHHTQLVKREDRLISIFHDLSLCPFYEKKEDIVSLLSDTDSWKTIGEVQQENFEKLFPNSYPEFANKFFQRIEKTDFRFSYFSDIRLLVTSLFKRFI